MELGNDLLGEQIVSSCALKKLSRFRHFINVRAPIRFSFSLALIAFLASCEELPPQMQQSLAGFFPMPAPSGYWNDEGAYGQPRIVVHLEEQKAYFYKGKMLVGESSVSTGRRGFSTPPGRYYVTSKDRNHISSEFGDYVDDSGNVVKSNIDVRKDHQPRGTHFDGAKMPYCMHFSGGYAMHEGYVPPYAASHGCIRLPRGMAEHFFHAANEGTPVIVKE
jgi:L,D-transpeptidase catalytic domain